MEIKAQQPTNQNGEKKCKSHFVEIILGCIWTSTQCVIMLHDCCLCLRFISCSFRFFILSLSLVVSVSLVSAAGQLYFPKWCDNESGVVYACWQWVTVKSGYKTWHWNGNPSWLPLPNTLNDTHSPQQKEHNTNNCYYATSFIYHGECFCVHVFIVE